MEILMQIAKGVYIPSRKIPSFGEVCKEWLAHKQLTVRASSFSSYEIYIRNYFGVFNDLKTNVPTTARIEFFISDKQRERMPINTVRYVRGVLNQILSYAVRYRYIERNPLSDAERLRGNSVQNRKTLKKAGLPDIRFHDLRYTFASLLINQAENIKSVQSLSWGIARRHRR